MKKMTVLLKNLPIYLMLVGGLALTVTSCDPNEDELGINVIADSGEEEGTDGGTTDGGTTDGGTTDGGTTDGGTTDGGTTDPVDPEPEDPKPTFAATLEAGEFDKDSYNIQNPWAVNPDNSSDYDFWDNIDLETIVEALDGKQNKGSSSGTSNNTPGSLKLDKASKRAYQAIKIEKDIEYNITAFVKNKDADDDAVVGTFYILGYEPANETIITTSNIVSVDAIASVGGAWDKTTINFTASTVFSFDQDSVDLQNDDLLTSVDEEWVILYFVPNLTNAGGEVNLDDFSIDTVDFVEDSGSDAGSVVVDKL